MPSIKSYDPSTKNLLGEIEITPNNVIDEIYANAREAKSEWAKTELEDRIDQLKLIIGEIADRKNLIAETMSKEMGMVLTEARYDVDDAIDYAHWNFDNASEMLSPKVIEKSATGLHKTVREPYGVITSYVPWNFPLSNLLWANLQALIAGNVIVLKHSELCPLSAEMIGDIFVKHLPKGVFAYVHGEVETGKYLSNKSVDMIAFKGSTAVGQQIYKKAAEQFVPVRLELGGSAPGIIMPDADLDIAIGNVCENRFYNCGQCCDGLKRLIVHEDVYDDVISRLKDQFSSLKIGEALNEESEIGPLVSQKQLDRVNRQVNESVEAGAQVIYGGKDLSHELGGFFYSPTLLVNVDPEMPVMQEEVFAPVLPVIKFNKVTEAVEVANNSKYGLGAYVYTKDSENISYFEENLESGMISVNNVSYIRPYNPFIGHKYSGIGVENGRLGFEDVTKPKLISMPNENE